ncbi:MAG: hypothetical protein EPO28_12775 [Saprospiraceae bacterium]|nr:MAG: hypothetical protein EPO28_12775 [Saprospiraceae bacterium]
MTAKILQPIFIVAALLLCAPAGLQAQKLPATLKVAKTNRPTVLLISTGELSRFHRNFRDSRTFRKMKLVKTELAYYLIAADANGPEIFAFELKQKGKRLCLDRYLPVQSCNTGELALDTFLESDGKIDGCRLGIHRIEQIQKNGSK